ncbi:MAG: cytochrome c-type biogenesis protein [Gemmatimonadaceae bacterium]
MKSLVALMVVALCAAWPARAQDAGTRPASTSTADSALEARTAAIAATLRCPVCQGEAIQDSPAELAQQMRAVVRDRLRAGETPDEIKAYFVSKYGEWILLEPRMTGLNILLYVFPVALISGGLALVAVLVRRWTTPKANADES